MKNILLLDASDKINPDFWLDRVSNSDQVFLINNSPTKSWNNFTRPNLTKSATLDTLTVRTATAADIILTIANYLMNHNKSRILRIIIVSSNPAIYQVVYEHKGWTTKTHLIVQYQPNGQLLENRHSNYVNIMTTHYPHELLRDIPEDLARKIIAKYLK